MQTRRQVAPAAAAGVCALLLACCLVVGAARPGTPMLGGMAAPRLRQLRAPEKYDRRPMAGWAKGAKSGGHPEPVRGLTTPDVPALGSKSASMEGEPTHNAVF